MTRLLRRYPGYTLATLGAESTELLRLDALADYALRADDEVA